MIVSSLLGGHGAGLDVRYVKELPVTQPVQVFLPNDSCTDMCEFRLIQPENKTLDFNIRYRTCSVSITVDGDIFDIFGIRDVDIGNCGMAALLTRTANPREKTLKIKACSFGIRNGSRNSSVEILVSEGSEPLPDFGRTIMVILEPGAANHTTVSPGDVSGDVSTTELEMTTTRETTTNTDSSSVISALGTAGKVTTPVAGIIIVLLIVVIVVLSICHLKRTRSRELDVERQTVSMKQSADQEDRADIQKSPSSSTRFVAYSTPQRSVHASNSLQSNGQLAMPSLDLTLSPDQLTDQNMSSEPLTES